MFAKLYKYLWCYWKHRKYRCYPEVWDRGLDGPWHCAKCHPCGEEFERLMKMLDTKEE